MSRLFDDDGSVIPNIKAEVYRVTLIPTKTNTKVVGAHIFIRAKSAREAQRCVQTWLKIPLNAISAVAVEDGAETASRTGRAQSELGARR